MRIADLSGCRVAIWGYGREGKAALTALHARLPALRPTLFCNEAEATILRSTESSFVGQSGAGMDDERDAVDVIVRAPTAADLSAFDVVIKSPGISAYRPEVLEAQHNGTHFTSGTALWFAEHPEARVIAVTGTKGKSTVTALIAHLLRSLGRRVALAGNIGLPLLELLDPSPAPDWWVVELSSFQTREVTGVEVAVLNNVYEEHLDWHGTRERYVEDKLALAAAARTLVANATQTELLARTDAHARRVVFGEVDGWHIAGGAVMRAPRRVFELSDSPLPGPHNALNLCAALAAIEAAGIFKECDLDEPLVDAGARQRAESYAKLAEAIVTFRPLPHRLQTLGERDGRIWVDDSIATTPQATLEALASLGEHRVTVLVGGHERGLDWRPFAQAVHAKPPRAIVTMGANGGRIGELLYSHGGDYILESTHALADAVRIARALTPVGGVVLLSPGAPSFDQFHDYAERGCEFARLAGFDPSSIGAIEGLGIR